MVVKQNALRNTLVQVTFRNMSYYANYSGGTMVTGWDLGILDFIQAHLRSDAADSFFAFITGLGDHGIVWIVFAVVLLLIPKTRKLGWIVVLALLLEVVLTDCIIKPLVARPRPFTVQTDVSLLVSPPTSFSFPSGHTGSAFAVVSALLFAKNKLWIPTSVLATLIAFSRLYLYVHYPSDVLVGLAIGFLCGWIANRILTRHQNARNARDAKGGANP